MPPLQPSRLPHNPAHKFRPQPPQADRAFRASTFTEAQDSGWALRPLASERLEKFFPEHELNKRIIEANSGGMFPAATAPPVVIPEAPTPVLQKSRVPAKQSIRIVAEEHKELIRKRNWESWFEFREATTLHANNTGGSSQSQHFH